MVVIVAITGASGAIYGIRLLEQLRIHGVQTHLVLSTWGERTITLETAYSVEQVKALADVVYAQDDLAAAISSGSYRTDAMVICPCSMKTLAAIRHGLSMNLTTRAADVILKERRKLILVPRETPLNQIHLENMLELSRMGAIIVPPMPGFYNNPRSIEDIIMQTVCRIMDQLNINTDIAPRWGEEKIKELREQS